MSDHPHYFATERRTMCGVLVGERSNGLHTFVEFLSRYQHDPRTVCPSCLRCMRRFVHYRGPLKAALQAYITAHGIAVEDLPPAVLPF